MTLKTDLQNRLKRHLAEKKENEREIAQTEEEINNCEILLNRAKKGMFQKGETELTKEETGDLGFEILALNDILTWYKSKLERNNIDIHLTQAKIEVAERN